MLLIVNCYNLRLSKKVERGRERKEGGESEAKYAIEKEQERRKKRTPL